MRSVKTSWFRAFLCGLAGRFVVQSGVAVGGFIRRFDKEGVWDTGVANFSGNCPDEAGVEATNKAGHEAC